MFSLITERGKYLRIRRGVDNAAVIEEFGFPPEGKVFLGEIIPIKDKKRFCFALAGDTYSKIAAREGVAEDKLRELNGGAEVYPTRRIWLP